MNRLIMKEARPLWLDILLGVLLLGSIYGSVLLVAFLS